MRKYRWNKRKCIRNLGVLLFRIAAVMAIILVAGFNPFHII